MTENPSQAMYELIRDYYRLNRTAVSQDTDRLVERVRQILDCKVLEVPSGQECLTWVIPKHWNVREADLARLDGTRIVDFQLNPLHLWTHSVSFDGEISRADLEEHLSFDSDNPDWVPYNYRNGYRFEAREWGFCLTYSQYNSLTEDRYRVHIDTDLDTNRTMKIVDHWLEGDNPETLIIAAHTCHPAIVTDGLSNVAVAVELFKWLKNQINRRYSYRLILGPEYFAAAGFLATVPESEIRLFRGGIFLDMLGNSEPIGYQTSFQADSILDEIVKNFFDHNVQDHIKRPYRKLWGNDEMFYNGPGFIIPTLCIGGGRHPEYHFDSDNLDRLNLGQLEESLTNLKRIVEVLESDFVPVPKFRGPLYLSRFGLYIDPKNDPKGYENIEAIQILMDGDRSCFEISNQLGLDFFYVRKFCEKVFAKGLLEKRVKNSLVE